MDLVVYALDYISNKQKNSKTALLIKYSAKDLAVMDLFAMLKIKVHAEADENVLELDPVPSLACGAVDDVQVVDVS